MLDKEKRLGKLISFYQLLPDPLLEEIISILPANRDIRRKLNKIKSSNEKVRMLMSYQLRKLFIDTAYITIKDRIPLTLNTSSYNDILASITEDNKYYIVIFFFRWCYEKGTDGSYNSVNYLDVFVDSDIFNSILKEKKIDGLQPITEKNEASSEIDDSNISMEVTETVPIDTKNEEVNTMKLLGWIEKKNTFYNFYPQYVLENGKFKDIPVAQLRADYPLKGAFNLAYNPYSGGAAAFLDEITTDTDDDQPVNNAYVIEIDNYDLEPNDHPEYQVKFDLQLLVQNGKKLKDIIRFAGEYGIFKVVHSETDNISDKTFISGNINLLETNITDGEMVVLFYNEKYYGPFNVSRRLYDDRFYINTLAGVNNYLLPFFSVTDVDVIELEKQANKYKDPTYTQFIKTYSEKEKFEDAITDELLLEKITDEVSIELAIKNPEEFSHLCSNSPFLAKLPREIISNRIDRLLDIINNVERFKEKKHEVFESLLKLYQESPSSVTDKMITDSAIYQDLQSKYDEERRKREDADKTIQQLRKAREDYNAQIVELRKSSEGTASSEEVLKLNETIDKLSSELEKKDRIIHTNENIEELEKKQKNLQTINENLIIQKDNYSRQIEDLRTDVINAIKSGRDEMASLAFDPFISSEMMRQAASWESTEEVRQYEKKFEKLSAVTPSSLNDTALIDYIVNYVKAIREYSRNDIINIYISIAQNRITIFSGEPGTGKTSMCNIIAETLGLLQYGEDINRFVSVSVERGWSSKRDLIGYYNPLTRKYDKSNGKIYDALRMLDVEKDKSKYPFIIMLDEANLSPIEYYWADFMRLTDQNDRSLNDWYINIGAERELYVPETLKFVATINTDQTTETLSPRLIDRACIIKLPKVEPKNNPDTDSTLNEIITWDNFYNTFSKTAELNPITQKAMKEIYKLFNDYGMSVSPRIEIDIKKYVMAAQEIMEDEPNTLAREKALDFAVVQKLLPKINGYYSVYERFFDSMKQLCKEYNLNMTEDAILKIIDAQERNMGYCQYLI